MRGINRRFSRSSKGNVQNLPEGRFIEVTRAIQPVWADYEANAYVAYVAYVAHIAHVAYVAYNDYEVYNAEAYNACDAYA
ncbi:hypothetical protein PUR_05440 [Paenibacillus sp. URB8-2]|nr:hypothetical protein PUR_05440 [Paenibacillus sp. URB8-2]